MGSKCLLDPATKVGQVRAAINVYFTFHDTCTGLSSSLSMLERHLASIELQLEWLHADSRYALCLACAMQLSRSKQSYLSSDITASAAKIREMIDQENTDSNVVSCQDVGCIVFLLLIRLVRRMVHRERA